MTIRKVERKDFPQWARMRASLWPDQDEKQHLLELDEFFNAETFQAWMAFDNDKAVGFAEASIRAFANGCDSRPVAFLEGIWVSESHRKTGVGRDLVRAVENWTRSKGLKELGSDTEFHNQLSQQCHIKWGFEETERVVYFRKKL